MSGAVHVTTVKAIFRGAGERNRGYALLMKANNPDTVLYRAPTFSLLLVSHGGLGHVHIPIGTHSTCC